MGMPKVISSAPKEPSGSVLGRRSEDDTGLFVPTGNPNPYRFELLRRENIGTACVVMIRYPDCKNYEGKKILVYRSQRTVNRMLKRGVLDPHFTDNKDTPFARFEPTEGGWSMALTLATMMRS